VSRRGLVIGYGNPGRGDDGLGPRLVELLEERGWPGAGSADVMAAFQLAPEHAADVAAHAWVVFADAAAGGPAPFGVRSVTASAGAAFTTHVVEPAAVLALAETGFGSRAGAWLLSIRGHRFGAGEDLSRGAAANLEAAFEWLGIAAGLLAPGGRGMGVTKTILIIDDDPDIRSALRIVLEAAGFSVGEASSGAEGLAAAERVEPDAVVVDLMMESVDAGSRLSQELKGRGFSGPIYLLSSAGESVRFNIDARELGLAGIFQKPLDHGVLVRTLKKTLRVE
jgi:hydrogenase maturation protease